MGVFHYFDMSHKSHDAYEDQPYYSHWASALFSLIVFIGELVTIFRQKSTCICKIKREANEVSVTFSTSF